LNELAVEQPSKIVEQWNSRDWCKPSAVTDIDARLQYFVTIVARQVLE